MSIVQVIFFSDMMNRLREDREILELVILGTDQIKGGFWDEYYVLYSKTELA